VLDVRNIVVSYGKIRALRDVSLRVGSREVFALIGANGAGKTTLLRAVMGLVPCASGAIRFEGSELSGQPTYIRTRRGISIVPEGRGLFPQFTVEENLLAGAYPRSDRRQVAEDLDKVYALYSRLRERRRQLAGGLSGGEGQMLALGRALMSRPKLLLLDEPSMGLMPSVVGEIFRMVADLRNGGMSILLVEQNAKKALAVADRAAVLQVGEVVLEGEPRDLLGDEQVRRAYFGA
jgi:branched-chain amino acid transport system ATP-binding protein